MNQEHGLRAKNGSKQLGFPPLPQTRITWSQIRFVQPRLPNGKHKVTSNFRKGVECKHLELSRAQ